MSRLDEGRFAAEVAARRGDGWSQPEIFDRNHEDSALALDEALLSGRVAKAHNSIEIIANGLFELNHPDLIDDSDRRKSYVESETFQGGAYGRWVLFPWSSDLVRFPDPDDYHELRTYRFRELISREEIMQMRMGRVAVIGMSLGGNVAVSLARNSVGGELFMSDLATPGVANLGRAEMDMRDMPYSKVDAIAKRVSYIDPFIHQEHAHEGITPETVDRLKEFHPDVLVDEVDDMRSSALIRKFCAEESIPYVTVSDVHDTVVLEVCRHDLSDKTPLYAKGVKGGVVDQLLSGQASSEDETEIFAKSVGYVNLTPRLVSSGLKIGSTLAGIPQLGTTAVSAAGVATAAVRDIMLGRELNTGRYRSPVSHARKRLSPREWFNVAQRYRGLLR